MIRRSTMFATVVVSVLAIAAALAPPHCEAEGSLRLIQPKFVETGHAPPKTLTPPARAAWKESMDVAVLAGALALASFLALRKRSRKGMIALSLFSIAYFGFYRKGCVCPVGSVQNMVSAWTDPLYLLPWTIVAFFTLPLAFALFFGRTFCGAVCPLGTLQEMFVIRPLRLPLWLERPLRLGPYLVLGLAIVVTASGGGYMICRYDPFVGFFRLGGPFVILVFGGVLLILGTVVGRPYCRFLCPYSVLLNACSRLSWRHVGVTPDTCVKCRLCEGACPYDCILFPTPARPPETRAAGVRRLAGSLLLLPVLVAGGVWLGARLAGPLSSASRTVRLADQVAREDAGLAPASTIDSQTFRVSRQSVPDLAGEARAIRASFRRNSSVLGGFLGLAFGANLVGLAVRRRREDYVPDRGHCVSCARCFRYCPKEHERLKKLAKRGTAA